MLPRFGAAVPGGIAASERHVLEHAVAVPVTAEVARAHCARGVSRPLPAWGSARERCVWEDNVSGGERETATGVVPAVALNGFRRFDAEVEAPLRVSRGLLTHTRACVCRRVRVEPRREGGHNLMFRSKSSRACAPEEPAEREPMGYTPDLVEAEKVMLLPSRALAHRPSSRRPLAHLALPACVPSWDSCDPARIFVTGPHPPFAIFMPRAATTLFCATCALAVCQGE